MSDRKKILITGGTGLVGNVLSNMLLKKGYEVAILSRNPGQKGQIRLYKWDIAQQYIDPEAFENTQCDAVYSNLYYVKSSNTNKIIRLWDSGDYQLNDFYKGWMPPHPAFFAKRSVYQKYGAFNTLLKSAADYELMLRLIFKNKIKLQYIPKFFVKMRTGGASNRSLLNRVKANMEDRKAWYINKLEPKWYTLMLKPLIKLFQYRFFSYFRPDNLH
jgi:hypothetical protein